MYAEAFFWPRRAQIETEFPHEARFVWDWFLELDRSRQSGMQANPISHLEIEAFARLHGLDLETWEVRAIRSLDDAAMLTRHKKHSRGKTKTDREPDELISARDGVGVKSLMQGLKSRGS